MNLKEYLYFEFFTLGSKPFYLGQLFLALLSIAAVYYSYLLLIKKILPIYFEKELRDKRSQDKIFKVLQSFFLVLALLLIVLSFDLNKILFTNRNVTIKTVTILEVLLILPIARLADWFISKFIVQNYNKRGTQETEEINQNRKLKGEKKEKAPNLYGSKITKYIVYVFAIILIFQNLNLDYTIWQFTDGKAITLLGILKGLLTLFLARLFVWVLTEIILFVYFKKRSTAQGSRYAMKQLIKYVIYTITIFVVLENLHIKPTVVWGGAAALLVGVGLGLQQTFNDFFSGILLLFEGTVEVGDVVSVDNLVGTVRKIGPRTSIVETRDNISVVVPNSNLVTDRVINWSHDDDKVRFKIVIGVAYGSDIQMVKSVLLDVAKNDIYVLNSPGPFVRFTDFGDSALIFELHFWSRNIIVIEDIKSDLRFEIDKQFRINNISIPFPQRDVWMKK